MSPTASSHAVTESELVLRSNTRNKTLFQGEMYVDWIRVSKIGEYGEVILGSN